MPKIICTLASARPCFFVNDVASIKHVFNEIHYEMVHKVAEGGMGVVYEAYQRGAGNFKKVVAVKLIREEYSAIENSRRTSSGRPGLSPT